MILICEINFYFQNEMDYKVRNVKNLCFIKHFLGGSSYIWSDKFLVDGMMELFEKQKGSSNFKIRQFENFLFRKTIWSEYIGAQFESGEPKLRTPSSKLRYICLPSFTILVCFTLMKKIRNQLFCVENNYYYNEILTKSRD